MKISIDTIGNQWLNQRCHLVTRMSIQEEEKCLANTTAFRVGNGSLDKLLNNSRVKNLNLLRWVLI